MLSRGAAVVFVSTLLAGVQHAPTEVVLLSVTATVLAWDAGTTAISVGAHLGRDASTIRIEAIHLGSSLVVGALVVGGGYLLYQGATGQRPVAALVLLIVAAVLLLVTVQYEPDADSW